MPTSVVQFPIVIELIIVIDIFGQNITCCESLNTPRSPRYDCFEEKYDAD